MGVFITLAEPTRPMLAEAVETGFYEPISANAGSYKS